MTAVIEELMSGTSIAVHVGRSTLPWNDSGWFWSLQPAARSSKAHRRILQLFAGNVIFFIVANNYYMVVFDDFVRTAVAGTENNRRFQ